MLTFLSKIHPVCHNIANGIEPEVTQKRLISTLPIAQKAVCWGVKCINCSYNNIAKGMKAG